MNSYAHSSPKRRRRDKRARLDRQRFLIGAGGFVCPLIGALSAALDRSEYAAHILLSLAFAWLSGCVFFAITVLATRVILDGSDNHAS